MAIESKVSKLTAMVRRAEEALAKCDARALEELAANCVPMDDTQTAFHNEDVDSHCALVGDLRMLSCLLAHTAVTLKMLRKLRMVRSEPIEYLPVTVHGK